MVVVMTDCDMVYQMRRRILLSLLLDVMFKLCCWFQMHISQLSEKVHAERSKNPPVMIEGKTTEQAMQKIRCFLDKNVSPATPFYSLLEVF